MIIAGIDEAGYGPLLGPLVVGCSAFACPGDNVDDPPCLWKLLGRLVSRSRSRSGRKIHVNDSKAVYSPSAGLRELERSVLTLANACHGPCESLQDFLAQVCPDALADLAGHAWYDSSLDERFPLDQESMPLRLFANALKAHMNGCGARLVHLQARVLPERRLNQMLAATRNKSSVLFSTAAVHLDYLLRTFGEQNLLIVCDRQGGREHYGHLLRMMFDQWALEVLAEADGRSEYRLHCGGHAVKIIFTEKAEAQCLSVALASMLSKYLRETLMRRFNGWWRKLLPDLSPTAGYYTDGERFLRDIDDKRRELGIRDEQLVRSR